MSECKRDISCVWIIYYMISQSNQGIDEVHEIIDSVYVDKELAEAVLEIYKKEESEYTFWLDVEAVSHGLPQSF